jgi:hypothetical protein
MNCDAVQCCDRIPTFSSPCCLLVEATRFSKMLVSYCNTAQCHCLEDLDLNLHCHGNIKSCDDLNGNLILQLQETPLLGSKFNLIKCFTSKNGRRSSLTVRVHFGVLFNDNVLTAEVE